jgi:S1-C subfamily serine protease
MVSDYKIASALQPRRADYSYDLDRALSAVVGIRSIVPSDAFTAETLGTERAGNGVLIRPNGLVLTIGYLVAEAETVWITLHDGSAVPGHVLSYDYDTGFGLVQALAHLDAPFLKLGESSTVGLAERVVVAGAGGRAHSVAARIVAKQEFAGYWEYVLNEAFFTAPAHPNWGGTAVIGSSGDLIGIGSLQLQRDLGSDEENSDGEPLNMVVPIDLLRPNLDTLLTRGRLDRPARPWLGLYATEIEDRVVVIGLASRGPAQRADVQTGDIVVAVGETQVNDLGDFFRAVWALGDAGVDVPLSIYREGRTFEATIHSADRSQFLKTPRMH